MHPRLFAQMLARVGTTSAVAALVFAVVAATTSNQPGYAGYAGRNKFFCAQENGETVTKVITSRGPETFIRWVVKDFKQFPPLKRCNLVSNRFLRYYDNGSIFITSRDNFNGYPVLCISDQKGAPCTSDNILVTLRPGEDAGLALKQIIAFRRGTGTTTIELSGSQYITYEQGDLYLDVKKLVDSTDSKDNDQSSVTTKPRSQTVEPRF
ncbi:COP23 domain-containing protein [Aetokthonos hydrillicola Thurmond2011]|jgi:hypothetical protein|uniref:COP23 domain-containing protein n=1 Tax=Aetokthonos hydrillicola Thurmond2011 TaxID=2712845 RepID=A0AAP5I9G6_9CYAN|nr:COP23 domain-containing protein [Aetokthonos hydrillicola]MBO3460982.1 hypothetical protein [Aetokthonos hydrillicola CCALA 1050]MBW4583656.1 COP23 domain-containing protein [Aetokthonos hydrillicola CCALA 1050]MDR9895648.1 COP23 domain-containing protein [Aetokthonos hydrillicola Thurmond2011]